MNDVINHVILNCKHWKWKVELNVFSFILNENWISFSRNRKQGVITCIWLFPTSIYCKIQIKYINQEWFPLYVFSIKTSKKNDFSASKQIKCQSSKNYSTMMKAYIYCISVLPFLIVCLSTRKGNAKVALQQIQHHIKGNRRIKFLVVGDWGRKGAFNQSKVGRQVKNWILYHENCIFGHIYLSIYNFNYLYCQISS